MIPRGQDGGPRSLKDARWGRMVRVQDFRPGDRVPVLMGMGSPNPDEVHDWTIYVQRRPSMPTYAINPMQDLHHISVRWGTGGAGHQERLPLPIGADYVLHYTSGEAPEVYLELGGISQLFDDEYVTVTCAPGRPQTHVIPFFVGPTHVEVDPDTGVIQWAYAALEVPWGAVRVYARVVALTVVPGPGQWEILEGGMWPARQWPYPSPADVLAESNGVIWLLGESDIHPQQPGIVDGVRVGQQGAAVSRAWCCGDMDRAYYMVWTGPPSGEFPTAMQWRLYGWWEVVR